MTMTAKTQLVALLGGASLLALCMAPATAQTASTAAAEAYADRLEMMGNYLTGDKHNHTTCTDGTTSIRTLVDRSTLVYDLDWFAQAGHGGSGNRDCRFDDIQTGNYVSSNGALVTDLARSNPRRLWVDTIGRDALKGDEAGRGTGGNNMWRWQSLIEYAYPDVANAGRVSDKTTWLGLETNTPGHEHTSMGILGKQFSTVGNAYAMGQFEYLWDRGDNDTSGGDEYDFENPANRGVAKTPNVAGNHDKAVASVAWLRKNYANDSYYVVAHIERQGGYVTTANNGTNIEHLRDYHNAGLLNAANPLGYTVAFGMESQPGHQFDTDRGGYGIDTPTIGYGTYGGSGAYTAAETTVAGQDFDGTPLTVARLTEIAAELDAAIGGPATYAGFQTNRVIPRYILGKPGIKTVWDAMLGEGRRFFYFASSDWHNRGAFGPFEPHSTNDAWPGEYAKIYAYARGTEGGYNLKAAREVVRGMQVGNTYTVMGDLITELDFVMCQGTTCATMGETLRVNPTGADVVLYTRMRDPEGANHSPYTFNNPSLLQIGREVPLNRPVLDNVDIIRGDVTGIIDPSDPAYKSNVSNASTEIFETIDRADFTQDGEYLVTSVTIPAASFTTNMYFRMRGTNMPKATPNETTVEGHPLLDFYANNIPCPFAYTDPNPSTPLSEFNPASCPQYLPINPRLPGSPQIVDFDVEGWADLWFYANPIFVTVTPAGRRA